MRSIACLQIADFNFGIFTESELPIVIEEGFNDFILEDVTEVDRHIIIHQGLIELPISATLSYEAIQQKTLLWKVYQQNDGIFLDVFHPTSFKIQQRAFYSSEKRTWDIYCLPTKNQDGELVLNPLAYPMAPLIWYYLTTEEDVIMLHASGISAAGIGRIFAGFSGVGKSTLAQLWSNEGAEVINDDRLLLRIKSDGLWIYNTPMPYFDFSKKSPVHHLYLPFHAPLNSYESLSGAKAIANLLAFCIQHGYKKEILFHHVDVVQKILKKSSIARLGVVPEPSICNFIQDHEIQK